MSTPPPLTPFPPTPPAPPMRDQRPADAQHLQLLMIFHFVLAGFALLGIALLLVHYLLFSSFFMNPQMWRDAQHHQQLPGPPFPAQEFFKIFIWMYIFFGLWGLLAVVANILSGIFLKKRTNRTFCLVVAGLNCLHIPLGTVLGIFTIIVLSRPSVAELYEIPPTT